MSWSSASLLRSITLILTINLHSIVASRYHVDPSKSSSGNGLSWSNAFNSLDTALSSATKLIDEIYLKGGYTYYPSNPTDRTDCFKPNKGISIYGGFSGTETDSSERAGIVEDRPKSIISGDIGILNDKLDNCYHVIQYNQLLTLDGVIIQDGNANYNGNYSYDNVQTNALHRYGGALITSDISRSTELYLQDVIIRNNTAINGGGLFFYSTENNNVDVIIRDSTLEYNEAIDGQYEGGYGAGLYAMFLANVTLFNTGFNGNKADFRGGAIYQDYGAYLYVDSCLFTNNIANGFGGAVFSEDRNSQTSGTFPTVMNSIFQSNYASVDGGAIYWYNGVMGTLTNNQFTTNTAGNKGAVALAINTQSTSTGNTYTGNIANGDSSTNDEYIEDEADLLHTTIDSTLSFDITAELSELYDRFIVIDTDLFPFSASNPMLYIRPIPDYNYL